jgi:NADH:ubiquinone oxidoreductase subunit K
MMEVTLQWYLCLAAFLFCAGLALVLVKRNAILILIGIELMLNGAHVNFAAFSRYDVEMGGQLFAVFSVVLAAAEASIALAILLNVVKHFNTADLDEVKGLGG